jgi:hypothetical protein
MQLELRNYALKKCAVQVAKPGLGQIRHGAAFQSVVIWNRVLREYQPLAAEDVGS